MTDLPVIDTTLEIENYDTSKIAQKLIEDIKFRIPTNESNLKLLYEHLNIDLPQSLDFFEKRAYIAKLIALNEEKRALFEKIDDSLYENTSDEQANTESDFYTPASIDLIDFRKTLIQRQFDQKNTHVKSLQNFVLQFPIATQIKQRRALLERLSLRNIQLSETGSERPISAIKLYQDDAVYFGTWNGEVKVYHPTDGTIRPVYEHAGKVSGLDIQNDIVVSGSTDCNINICKITEDAHTPETLTGHTGRVSKTRFLPNCNGEYIVSASYDTTWRLWNVASKKEIMLQEGHNSEISSISTNRYGSLVFSGALNGMGVVWDIRSGNKVMDLQHAKAIHCSDWTWNDALVTGSADGSIQVWDLRQQERAQHIIPAHTSVVTDVKLDENDQYMVSSSFDRNVNVYSTGNWLKKSTLEGNLDKILCLDIDENKFVTGGWDRSVKVWK